VGPWPAQFRAAPSGERRRSHRSRARSRERMPASASVPSSPRRRGPSPALGHRGAHRAKPFLLIRTIKDVSCVLEDALVIDCNYCQASVDGRSISAVLVPGLDLSDISLDDRARQLELDALRGLSASCFSNVRFAKGNCHRTALVQTDDNGDPVWSNPSRCWPSTEKYPDVSIPLPIRASLARLEFCTLRHRFRPFHKGLEDFSCVRIHSGVAKNPFLPSNVT
jgi:hypothetical protein